MPDERWPQPGRAAAIGLGGGLLGGALLGGAVMYLWGEGNLDSVNNILTRLPALDASMIEGAREGLADNNYLEMLGGSLSGTPYKIYATNAASLGIGLEWFLLLSIPARLPRWLLFGLVVWGAQKLLLLRFSVRVVKSIYLSCWLIFYTFFFLL